MRDAAGVTRSSPAGSADPELEKLTSLIARVASDRDRDAFRELFEHYGPRVKAMMMKSGADAELAEDVVQDVMLSVWRKVGIFSPERGSLNAWIYTIARNARIDRLRKYSSRAYYDIDDFDIESDALDGEEELLVTQQAEHVSAALCTLPKEQREIIELAYMQDMAQSEISKVLSLPLGTVKSRMRLAYVKLKLALEGIK